MNSARKRFGVSTLLVIAAFAAKASAQDDPAGVLFREGRDAAKRGDFAAACPKFTESYALAAKVGTLFNLADCEERLGKASLALLSYQRLIGMLDAADERLAIARARVAELEKRVARLTLVGKPPAGAVVRRNGVDIPPGALGESTILDAGGYVVSISTPGRPEVRIDVVLHEGERREVNVGEPPKPQPASPAQAEPQPAPSATRADDKEPEGGRTTAYVLGGIGTVALVASGVTGFMALSRKQAMSDHCDAAFACDREGLDAASSGKSLAKISTYAFAVGALSLGAGIYFYTTPGKRTAAGLTPSPGGASLSLRRGF